MEKQRSLRNYVRILWLVLLAALILIMWGKFVEMQASIEEASVNFDIKTLRYSLPYQQMLNQRYATIDEKFDKIPEFLKKMGFIAFPFSLEPSIIPVGRWGYNKITHQLVYHVRANRYFLTPTRAPYLIMQFAEIAGKIQVRLPIYTWCVEKRWWGCEKW